MREFLAVSTLFLKVVFFLFPSWPVQQGKVEKERPGEAPQLGDFLWAALWHLEGPGQGPDGPQLQPTPQLWPRRILNHCSTAATLRSSSDKRPCIILRWEFTANNCHTITGKKYRHTLQCE